MLQGFHRLFIIAHTIPFLIGEAMWYDVNKTLSYNCLFNFVVGPRGVGKTYSCKRRVIKDFITKGQQFIYLRRYETEIKSSQIDLFFDDIQHEFQDHALAVKKKCFYIDGKLAGWALPLSRASQFKSVPFPYVTKILFDEFIIDQGLIRYLPDEVQTFNEMYSTIARLRDVTVLFLSNAITFTNPYFLYYDLSLQKGQKILRKNDILLELVDSPAYTEKAKSTRFGKIIAETEYGKYAMENEFLRDTASFIEKMPCPGTCIMTIRVSGNELGVYTILGSDLWYITESYDPTCNKHISLSVDEHDETTELRNSKDALIWLGALQQKYYRGEVRFTTMKAKNLISNSLMILRR